MTIFKIADRKILVSNVEGIIAGVYITNPVEEPKSEKNHLKLLRIMTRNKNLPTC